jgi:hypothetical protein
LLFITSETSVFETPSSCAISASKIFFDMGKKLIAMQNYNFSKTV